MSLVNMLAKEHQIEMFLEFESRKSEFLRLIQREKAKEDRKRVSAERCEKAIQKKTQGQLKAYRLQKEKIQIRTQIELNEGTLRPQKLPL